MLTSRKLLGSTWLIGMCGLVASCSDEASDGETTAKAAHGDACENFEDCESDLVCPQGGTFQRRCVFECEDDFNCHTRLGDNFYCLDDFCTTSCGDECGFGTVTTPCAAGFHCVNANVLNGTTFPCELDWCVP